MKALLYISVLFFLGPLANATENCGSAVKAEMENYAAQMANLPKYEPHGGVSLDSVSALGNTDVNGLIAYHAVLSVADFGLDLYHILVNPHSCRIVKKTLIWKGDF